MKALIIGGGIAGLATAQTLRRAGIETEVFEGASSLREVGAGIWVAPNAMAVLDAMGLSERIMDEGHPYAGQISVSDSRGRALMSFSGEAIRQRFGFTTTATHRARLQRALLDGAGEVRVGKRLAGIEQDGAQVTARFADGSSATGDILIGADGIGSVVREQLFGPTRRRDTGQTCYRVVTSEHALLEGDARHGMTEMWGDRGGLRLAFGSIGQGEVYLYMTEASRGVAAGPVDGATQARLVELARGFAGPAHALLAATAPADILHNDLHDFAPIRRWHQGRVVLVGDAAHATTPNLGQGACQAIESAWALGAALSHSVAQGSPPERAFACYQRERIRKAHHVTQTSWRLGQLVNLEHRWARAMRDALMRITPRFVHQRMFEQVFRVQLSPMAA
jgi:2-polyprenyl-6-methoxyphenol hydroxylase-like FAD-dependent oxidoreductase